MTKGKVLIDGDILCYRAAFSTQDQTLSDAISKVDSLTQDVISRTVDFPFPDPSDYQVFLTGSTNFRFEVAKAAPYKGNRVAKEKPKWLRATR